MEAIIALFGNSFISVFVSLVGLIRETLAIMSNLLIICCVSVKEVCDESLVLFTEKLSPYINAKASCIVYTLDKCVTFVRFDVVNVLFAR